MYHRGQVFLVSSRAMSQQMRTPCQDQAEYWYGLAFGHFPFSIRLDFCVTLPEVLVYTFNASTWEEEAGRSEWKASLVYRVAGETLCQGDGVSVLHTENKKRHNPCHTEDIHCLHFLPPAHNSILFFFFPWHQWSLNFVPHACQASAELHRATEHSPTPFCFCFHQF